MSERMEDFSQYNRRASDKRIEHLEAQLRNWTIKLTTAATIGVLCWGGISWFVVDKLTQINKSMEQVQKLANDMSLMDYKQSEQVRHNSAVLTQLERHQSYLESLQTRVTRLESERRN